MSPDRGAPFCDKLLVKDVIPESAPEGSIAVEALFDDLAVSGYIFPLNRFTKSVWDAQPAAVQEQFAMANTTDIKAVGRGTIVTLCIWGTWKISLEGAQYLLSPRFIDFKTTRILSPLFEIDLWYKTDAEVRAPYLQLIQEHLLFGCTPMSEMSLKIEGDVQKLFRDLAGLGSESAKPLVLKPYQHKAVQRMSTNWLSVIWDQPGEYLDTDF